MSKIFFSQRRQLIFLGRADSFRMGGSADPAPTSQIPKHERRRETGLSQFKASNPVFNPIQSLSRLNRV